MNFDVMPDATVHTPAPMATPPPRPPPPGCSPRRQASPSLSQRSSFSRPSSASSRSRDRSEHRRHSSSPFEPRRNSGQSNGRRRPEITIISAQPMSNHPAFADGNKGGYIPPEAPPSYEQAMRSAAPRNPTFTDPAVPDHISEVRRVFPEVTLAVSRENHVPSHHNQLPSVTSEVIHHTTTVTSSNSTPSTRPCCNNVNFARSSETLAVPVARHRNLNHSNNEQSHTTVHSDHQYQSLVVAGALPEQTRPAVSSTSSCSSSTFPAVVQCKSTKPQKPAIPPKKPSLVKLSNSNNNSNTVKGKTTSSDQSEQQTAPGTSSQDNNNELSTVNSDTASTSSAPEATMNLASSNQVLTTKQQNTDILSLFDSNIPPSSGSVLLPTPLQPSSTALDGSNGNSSLGGSGNNGVTMIPSPTQRAVNKCENATPSRMTPLVSNVPNPLPGNGGQARKVPPPRPSCGPRKSSTGNSTPMIVKTTAALENDFSEAGYDSIKYPVNPPLGGAIAQTTSPPLGSVLTPTKVSNQVVDSTVPDDVFLNAGYASIQCPPVSPSTNSPLGGMLTPKMTTVPGTHPLVSSNDSLDPGYASITYPQSGAHDNSSLGDTPTPTKVTTPVVQLSLSLSDSIDPGYASIKYPQGGVSMQSNVGSPSSKALCDQASFMPGGLLTPTKIMNASVKSPNVKSGNDNHDGSSSQPTPVNLPLGGLLTPTKANQSAGAAQSPLDGDTNKRIEIKTSTQDNANSKLDLLGGADKPGESVKPLTPIPVPRKNMLSDEAANKQGAVREPVYAAVDKKRASKTYSKSEVEGHTLVQSTMNCSSAPPPPVPATRPPLEDFEDLFSADEMNKAMREREKIREKTTENKEESPGYASISTSENGNLDDLLGFGPLAPSTETSSKTSTTESAEESSKEKIEPVYESRTITNTQDVAAGDKLPHVVHSSRPPILPPPRSKKSTKEKSSKKKPEKKVPPPLPKSRPTQTELTRSTSSDKSDQKDKKSPESHEDVVSSKAAVMRKHSDGGGSKFAKNLKRRSMKWKNSIFKQKSIDDGNDKKIPEQNSNTETATEIKNEPSPKLGSKPPKPAIPRPPRPNALPNTKLPTSPTSPVLPSPMTPTASKVKPPKPPPPKKGPQRPAPAPPRRESTPSNDLLTLEPIQAPASPRRKSTPSNDLSTIESTQTTTPSRKESTPTKDPLTLEPVKVQSIVTVQAENSANDVANANNSNHIDLLSNAQLIQLIPTPKPRSSSKNEGTTAPLQPIPEATKVKGPCRPAPAKPNIKPSLKPKRPPPAVPPSKKTQPSNQKTNQENSNKIPEFGKGSSHGTRQSMGNDASTLGGAAKPPQNLTVDNPDGKPSKDKEQIAVAMFDFTGMADDELSFKIGERITVLSEKNEDWFKGQISDRCGIFPKNFVKITGIPADLEIRSLPDDRKDGEMNIAKEDIQLSWDTEPYILPEGPGEMDAKKKQDATGDDQDRFSAHLATSSSRDNESSLEKHPEDAAKQDQDEHSAQPESSSLVVHLVDEQMDLCGTTNASETVTADVTEEKTTHGDKQSPLETATLRCSSMALFPFEGQDESELTFAKGDMITVTGRVNDEWLTGEIYGKTGMFPANYIEGVTDSSDYTTSDTSVTNTLSLGANDDALAPTCGGFVEPMATAIKDYTAPSSDEISFKTNDTLYLLEQVDSNWFMAQNDQTGSVGKVPVSHVKVVHPLPEGGSSMSWIM